MDARLVLASAAFVCAVFACRGNAGPGERKLRVYVPSGEDAAVDASANGFGLGQVDRAGRPLVAVLLVPGSLQDEYNAASTFDAPLSRTLQDALASRLETLDTIALGDGGPDPVDWTADGGMHPLLPMFAQDSLLVDTALPCTSPDGGFAPSYLDIEREIFLSQATHTTCGGRTPIDNVVDATLTLLVTGGRDGGPSVTQGALGPTKPPTLQFPYLAGP
jgi:hypothetical protein